MDVRFPYIPRLDPIRWEDGSVRWDRHENVIKWRVGYRGIYTVKKNFLFMTLFLPDVRFTQFEMNTTRICVQFLPRIIIFAACNRRDSVLDLIPLRVARKSEWKGQELPQEVSDARKSRWFITKRGRGSELHNISFLQLNINNYSNKLL